MYNITDNTKYYFYDLMDEYYIEFKNEKELIVEIAKAFYQIFCPLKPIPI